MAKKFNPEMAEREANKIGLEFAHSNDVVKDMSRAYNVDFSNIRVHTDSAADNKVKAAGKDALAQGNDLFFGKGIFESNDPADKGLVAHEFAHTMQQGAAMGGEMAVAESAPMGMAQGGLSSFFKNLFGGGKDKKQPASTPSVAAPKPVSAPMPKKTAPAGPTIRNHINENGVLKYVAPSLQEAMKDPSKRLASGEEGMTFLSKEAMAIYELTKTMSPEEINGNEGLRTAILDVFQRDMPERLKGYEGASYENMFSELIRNGTAPEWRMYNQLLGGGTTEQMTEAVAAKYGEHANKGKDLKVTEIEKYDFSGVDEALEVADSQIFSKNGEMTKTEELLKIGMETLGNSSHFSGDNEVNASRLLMNNVFLRGYNPYLQSKANTMQNQWVSEQAAAEDARLMDERGSGMSKVERMKFDVAKNAEARNTIGKEYSEPANVIQKSVAGEGFTKGSKRFLEKLVGRYKK